MVTFNISEGFLWFEIEFKVCKSFSILFASSKDEIWFVFELDFERIEL